MNIDPVIFQMLKAYDDRTSQVDKLREVL